MARIGAQPLLKFRILRRGQRATIQPRRPVGRGLVNAATVFLSGHQLRASPLSHP